MLPSVRALAPLLLALCAAQEPGGAARIALLPAAGEALELRLEFVAPEWLEPPEHAGVADLAVALLNRAAGEQGPPGELRVGHDARKLWFELEPSTLAEGLARAGALRALRSFPAEELAAAREALAALHALRARDPSEPEESVLELLTGSGPPCARAATLATLDAAVLSRFLDQALAPQRLWLASSGGGETDPARVRALVAEHLGATGGELVAGATALAPAEPGLRGLVLDLPDAVRCDLRFSLEARAQHAQYAELLLLADVFAADPRRNPGGRWSVIPAAATGGDGSPLYLYCSVRVEAGREALAEALRAGLALLDRLDAAGITAGDVERARTRRLRTEQVRGTTGRLRRALAELRAPEAAAAQERVLERLAEIELADLEQRVESLPAAPLLLAVTGPASVLEPLLAEQMPVEVLAARRHAVAAGTPAGRAQVERLLAAVGGRERWSALTTLRTRSTAELAEVQGLIKLVTTVDLERGLLRLDNHATPPASWVVRPDAGWLLQAGTARDLSPVETGRLRERQLRSLYSVLHALALERTSPPSLGAGERLELADAAGVWCWLRLDPDGLPERLGYQLPGEPLETVYAYSDWQTVDGWRYPRRTHQLERGNEYETQSFEPNAELDEGLFARP